MNAMMREWKIGDVVAPAVHPTQAGKADPSWYVLQVFAGAEGSVERRIARLARRWRVRIDVYCPLQKAEVPRTFRRGRLVPARTVVRPAFPGYLFIGLRDGRLMLDLDQVGGAIDFVRQLGAPVILRQAVIDRVRAAETGGILDVAMPVVRLRIAETIRIIAGPFAGFNARLVDLPDAPVRVDMADEHMATVAVDLFGQETPVHLPLSDIEAA